MAMQGVIENVVHDDDDDVVMIEPLVALNVLLSDSQYRLDHAHGPQIALGQEMINLLHQFRNMRQQFLLNQQQAQQQPHNNQNQFNQ